MRRVEQAWTTRYSTRLTPAPSDISPRRCQDRFLIYVPELPGLATEADTREEAIAMLRDALPAYLESMRAHDLPLPQVERGIVAAA